MSAYMWRLAVLAALAAGCSSVQTEHPVSAHPEVLDKDRLEGLWLLEDEVVHVRFGADNVGRLAAIDWDGSEFRVRRLEFIVAHAGEGRYLSLRDEDEDHYDLFAYEFADDGDLVVRAEPTDAFAAAVAEGRLRGELRKEGDETEVVLASPSDSLAAFLASAAPADLFEGTTLILKKLPGSEDAE